MAYTCYIRYTGYNRYTYDICNMSYTVLCCTGRGGGDAFWVYRRPPSGDLPCRYGEHVGTAQEVDQGVPAAGPVHVAADAFAASLPRW